MNAGDVHRQKEVKRVGTIAGRTDEVQEAILDGGKSVLESGMKVGEGEENFHRADQRAPGKLELILRFGSEEHALLIQTDMGAAQLQKDHVAFGHLSYPKNYKKPHLHIENGF